MCGLDNTLTTQTWPRTVVPQSVSGRRRVEGGSKEGLGKVRLFRLKFGATADGGTTFLG